MKYHNEIKFKLYFIEKAFQTLNKFQIVVRNMIHFPFYSLHFTYLLTYFINCPLI